MTYPSKQNWNELPEGLRNEIENALTDKQLVAYRLALGGYSERRIAILLGISRQSVRDRLDAADRKLRYDLDSCPPVQTTTVSSRDGDSQTRRSSASDGSTEHSKPPAPPAYPIPIEVSQSILQSVEIESDSEASP